jgi:hydroxymethylbilane synthase
VAAERAVSRAMGGSCSMPLAAHATLQGEVLQLEGAWGDPDSQAPLVRAHIGGKVASLEDAAALGTEVAARLRAGGAR